MSNARQCFLSGLVFPLGCCVVAAASMRAETDSFASVPEPAVAAKLHPALVRSLESTSEPVKALSLIHISEPTRPY